MNPDLQEETGARHLRQLETFLDVAYVVLFVQFLHFLPHTEDLVWASLPYGLLSLLFENWVEVLRVIIAVGLTLFSWNLSNRLL